MDTEGLAFITGFKVKRRCYNRVREFFFFFFLVLFYMNTEIFVLNLFLIKLIVSELKWNVLHLYFSIFCLTCLRLLYVNRKDSTNLFSLHIWKCRRRKMNNNKACVVSSLWEDFWRRTHDMYTELLRNILIVIIY